MSTPPGPTAARFSWLRMPCDFASSAISFKSQLGRPSPAIKNAAAKRKFRSWEFSAPPNGSNRRQLTKDSTNCLSSPLVPIEILWSTLPKKNRWKKPRQAVIESKSGSADLAAVVQVRVSSAWPSLRRLTQPPLQQEDLR